MIRVTSPVAAMCPEVRPVPQRSECWPDVCEDLFSESFEKPKLKDPSKPRVDASFKSRFNASVMMSAFTDVLSKYNQVTCASIKSSEIVCSYDAYRDRETRIDALLSPPIRAVEYKGVQFTPPEIKQLLVMVSNDLADPCEPFVGMRGTGNIEPEVLYHYLSRWISEKVPFIVDTGRGPMLIRRPLISDIITYGAEFIWKPVARGDLTQREVWLSSDASLIDLGVVFDIYQQSKLA